VTGRAPLDPSVWSVGMAVSLVAVAAGFVRIGRALGGARRVRSAPVTVA
jgi:hypothetical protein